MNSDQLTSIFRALLAAGGPIAGLLTNAGLNDGAVNNILTVALIVVPPLISAVWGYIHNSANGKVIAAATVPGVQVHVDTGPASVAPMSVIDSALDRSVKDVVPMVGPPRSDTKP